MNKACYLKLNLKENTFSMYPLINKKEIVITANISFLGKYLTDILSSFKGKKKVYMTIFAFDLNRFSKILYENKQATITKFTYKGIIYNITYSDVIYPGKKLIFKDCANFLHNSKEKNEENNILHLEIIHEKMKSLFQIDIYGVNILSLVSIANAIYRKLSMDKRKLIKRLNEVEDPFIRRAYYGGRTEIMEPYYIGTSYFYDVNSLYPYVMKNNFMPIGVPRYRKKINKKEFPNFFGIINVHVRTPKNVRLPILPIKSDDNHNNLGIIYPTGDFKGVYFSEELKLALKHGYEIIEFYDGYEFDKQILFDKFVDTLYNLREKENNKVIKKHYKLLLNSLYGRFGCIYEEPRFLTNTENEYPYAVKRKFENVAICVAITAYARMHMYNIIINQKLDLLYWDTDGIIIKNLLNPSFIGTGLGKFKLVAQMTKFICLTTKFYMYKSEGKYYYVFRGFQKEKYKIKGSVLFNYFLNELKKERKNGYELILHFDIENKKGIIESKSFRFHNKRKLLYFPEVILTIPWYITHSISADS